jgi:hypothetical protein
MKLWRSSLLLLAAAGAIRAADPETANLMPRNTTMVFGVRVRPLVDTLEAQGVLKDLREQSGAFLPQAVLAGFDPFTDVDELLIASTGAGQDAPALAIVTGRFHVAKPGVIEAQKGSKQVMAFLNESTFVAGDLALVKAALANTASASGVPAALAQRVKEMRERYTVWGFADKLDAMPRQAGPAPKELESIDGFSFGAGIAHGLELAAELHVRNPKDVAQLSSMLREWEKMAMASGSTSAKIEIQSTRDTVKVAVSVSEDEIRKTIVAQRDARAATKAAAPVAPKPAERTIPEVVSDANGNTLRVTLPGKR